MLRGGLVFICDLIPLIAAMNFEKRLPEAFMNARMNLSGKNLRLISAFGICVPMGQAALPFSDIEITGWALVVVYLMLVLIYVGIRSRYRNSNTGLG